MRLDDVVDIAALGGGEGGQEAVFIFFGARGDLVGVADIAAEDDLDRALGAHHRDLRGRPGVVHVGADFLGRHHVERAAIGLAGDHGHQRHRALRIGEQQFGAVFYQSAIFLRGARQKTWHVDEGHDRNVEGVAKAHKARGLARGVRVEHARQHHRLVGDEAHRAPGDAAEARDDVLGKGLGNLEEVALVHDFEDQLLHVVGLVRMVGDQRIQRQVDPLDVVKTRPFRHAVGVVGGQEIDQPAHLQQRLDVVLEGAVGDRGARGVHGGAAEFFRGDDLVGDGLHHVGPGDEHVAGVLHHEDEVGHGRRIDVAAGAGAHDDGDLRDHARGDHVAAEHVGIARQCRDAFLDPRAAGVVKPDDRRPRLHRHVLDLDDFLRVGFGQRAAEHSKILGEHKGLAAVDGAPAGDDAVARHLGLVHAEFDRAMLDEHVELLERALVEQQFDALPRGQLAAGVLRLDALLAAAELGAGAALLEGVQDVFHGQLLPA